jgi:uncharacterized protein (TIGR03437 family)
LPTTLGGVSATITDVSGNNLSMSMIAISQSQAKAVLPSGLSSGLATVNLIGSNGVPSSCSVDVEQVAPSLFTADQSGSWLAAARVVITHSDGDQTFMDSVARYSSTLVWNGSTWSNWVPIPINLGSSTDVAVLKLFGTGIRGVNSLASSATSAGYDLVDVGVCTDLRYCTYNGPDLTVLNAGSEKGAGEPASFYGLDQINIVLPHSLAGSGMTFVNVYVTSYTNGFWMVAPINMVSVDIQ